MATVSQVEYKGLRKQHDDMEDARTKIGGQRGQCQGHRVIVLSHEGQFVLFKRLVIIRFREQTRIMSIRVCGPNFNVKF